MSAVFSGAKLIVRVDSNSVVLVPVQWYRQDLITREIYFAQTLLQLGKETLLIPT
jgi:hypothetical protein